MARSVLALCGSLVAATLTTGSAGGAAVPPSMMPTLNPAASPSTPAAPASPERSQIAAGVQPSLPLNPRAEASLEQPSAPPIRIPLAQSLLIAPRGCAGLKRSFDVLIHFHGAYTTVEPQLMKSGINAVYLIKNLGNGSGPYEAAFAARGALRAELDAIRSSITRQCGGEERRVGRVALSGWSAGYGAIRQILAHPASASRVDAVVLADGLHVGYQPGSRRLRTEAMRPFLEFARSAAQGDKLMAITHSAIVPPTYASTTETARFIVNELSLSPQSPSSAAEPRPGMRATSIDGRGSLHVTGYAGGDARAHCDHLHAISSTLWSRVRARWAAY